MGSGSGDVSRDPGFGVIDPESPVSAQWAQVLGFVTQGPVVPVAECGFFMTSPGFESLRIASGGAEVVAEFEPPHSLDPGSLDP